MEWIIGVALAAGAVWIGVTWARQAIKDAYQRGYQDGFNSKGNFLHSVEAERAEAAPQSRAG